MLKVRLLVFFFFFFFFQNVDDIIIQVILETFLNDVPRDALRLSVSLSKYYNRVCV